VTVEPSHLQRAAFVSGRMADALSRNVVLETIGVPLVQFDVLLQVCVIALWGLSAPIFLQQAYNTALGRYLPSTARL
jgi:hypothetical protein